MSLSGAAKEAENVSRFPSIPNSENAGAGTRPKDRLGNTMTQSGRTPDKPAQTFTKDQRVRARREFQEIFKNGKSLRGKWLVVRLEKNEGLEPAKIGLVISKRVQAKAVQRNVWKRRVREVFRRLAGEIKPGCRILVQARENARLPEAAEIKEEFEKQLKAFEIWETPSAEEKK